MIRSGTGSWQDARNRDIAVGFTIYKRSLHRCGYPIEKAFSGSINGYVQAQWVHCNVCEAQEKAKADLGSDDERRGQAWGTVPVDHFPYGDQSEPFLPYQFTARELDI